MTELKERRRQAEIAKLLSLNIQQHFEAFVYAYQDRMYAFAVSLTKDRTIAQEIAQDTFVRAYHALQTYDPARIRALSLRAWLYQISLNLIRNSRRRKRIEAVPLDGARDVATEQRVETSAEAAELALFVRTAVARLPVHLRAAVVLRHLDELSYDEIARITAQPVGTIKSNVHRGLAMLRKDLHHVTIASF